MLEMLRKTSVMKISMDDFENPNTENVEGEGIHTTEDSDHEDEANKIDLEDWNDLDQFEEVQSDEDFSQDSEDD